MSDGWRADAVSHPAAFYSPSVLVTIHCIFMANNNRRRNGRLPPVSKSERWRQEDGPRRQLEDSPRVNKLLRRNDWVHSCERLQPILQSEPKAASHAAAATIRPMRAELELDAPQ